MQNSIVVLLLCFVSIVSALFGINPSIKKSPTNAKGKPVVVLGGSGFVGSRVTKELAERGNCRVIAISRSGEIPKWALDYDFVNNVEWMQCDASDAVSLQKVLRGAQSVVSARKRSEPPRGPHQMDST